MAIGCLHISSLVAQNYSVNYNSCTGCTTTNPQYNTATTAFTLTGNGVIDVVSDFGRRNGNGISNWHRGVDITLKNPNTEDNGYHLLSITDGLIARIQGYAPGFKLISIDGNGNHDFGYAHIFRDQLPR